MPDQKNPFMIWDGHVKLTAMAQQNDNSCMNSWKGSERSVLHENRDEPSADIWGILSSGVRGHAVYEPSSKPGEIRLSQVRRKNNIYNVISKIGIWIFVKAEMLGWEWCKSLGNRNVYIKSHGNVVVFDILFAKLYCYYYCCCCCIHNSGYTSTCNFM